MNNLIIIAHPNRQSFCFNGIYKTIYKTLQEANQSIRVIDLYDDDFTSSKKDLVKSYTYLKAHPYALLSHTNLTQMLPMFLSISFN